MKILYLFRDSYDARFILSQLEKEQLVSCVVLEKGGKAKRRKLKRIFSNNSVWQYIVRSVDLAALVIYSSVMSNYMEKKMGEFFYPSNLVKLTVDDANDKACIDFIKKYKPDIIFIYGTAILKPQFLQSVKCPIFNIHTGILPYYRNVHSDFWAFKNKDFKNIGVTIIYLDAGIDSGDIALQRSIQYKSSDTLADIKVKNLKSIPQMVKELISKIKGKKVTRKKQDKKKYGFYPTPTIKDIIQLYRDTKKIL